MNMAIHHGKHFQREIKEAVVGAVVQRMDVNNEMANQVLNNPKTLEGFTRLLVDLVYEGFARRRQGFELV